MAKDDEIRAGGKLRIVPSVVVAEIDIVPFVAGRFRSQCPTRVTKAEVVDDVTENVHEPMLNTVVEFLPPVHVVFVAVPIFAVVRMRNIPAAGLIIGRLVEIARGGLETDGVPREQGC